MIFKCFPFGMFGSNCYIVARDGEGLLIDAGVSRAYIEDFMEKNELKIKNVILTHSHVDHICYLEDIKRLTGAKIFIHEYDAAGLTDSNYNGSGLFGTDEVFPKADELLKDGDIINLGEMKFEIILTPGHSLGSICIKHDNMLFTGDTLFRLSIGRTDFKGGSRKEIDESISKRILKLEDETVIYPGHGLPSTVGFERLNNPFIRK